jgi:hypothetical protein
MPYEKAALQARLFFEELLDTGQGSLYNIVR